MRYKLRFLPLLEGDLNKIVGHISVRLKNPSAAQNLVDSVREAIRKRASSPEAYEPYYSSRHRQYPYYRIYVKNYVVFYVIIGDVMEIRRILYNRQNYKDQI